MSELLNHLQEQWAFALGLVVGFPAAAGGAQRVGVRPRAGGSSGSRVGSVRPDLGGSARRPHALSPLGRAVCRQRASGSGSPRRCAWATVIVAIMGVINNLVFESARPGTWQSKVPRLLRDLLRLLLVAIGLAMVYSFVWGREIEGAIAALGVTSIVVGLALQEPLGNLFSGLDAPDGAPVRGGRDD